MLQLIIKVHIGLLLSVIAFHVMDLRGIGPVWFRWKRLRLSLIKPFHIIGYTRCCNNVCGSCYFRYI